MDGKEGGKTQGSRERNGGKGIACNEGGCCIIHAK